MLMFISRVRMNCGDLASLAAPGSRHSGRYQRVTLLFGQAAPYAVYLLGAQRERQAFLPDRASGADGLCLRYLRPGRAG